MLLLDDDDQLPDSSTEAETLLAESLGAAGLLAIDEAIVNAARTHWLKVARVVVDAIRAAGFSTEEAHVQLHVRRTIGLVSAGRLDVQGNVHRPRFSESDCRRVTNDAAQQAARADGQSPPLSAGPLARACGLAQRQGGQFVARLMRPAKRPSRRIAPRRCSSEVMRLTLVPRSATTVHLDAWREAQERDGGEEGVVVAVGHSIT
jgi:hypothetical protein